MAKRWTNWEKSILLRLANAGESAVEISESLDNRSPETVRKMTQVRGIKTGRTQIWKIDIVQRAALLNYLRDNPTKTLADAAKFLNRSRQSVRIMAHKLVKEGLLERTGGKTNSCRYVITEKWSYGGEDYADV